MSTPPWSTTANNLSIGHCNEQNQSSCFVGNNTQYLYIYSLINNKCTSIEERKIEHLHILQKDRSQERERERANKKIWTDWRERADNGILSRITGEGKKRSIWSWHRNRKNTCIHTIQAKWNGRLDGVSSSLDSSSESVSSEVLVLVVDSSSVVFDPVCDIDLNKSQSQVFSNAKSDEKQKARQTSRKYLPYLSNCPQRILVRPMD